MSTSQSASEEFHRLEAEVVAIIVERNPVAGTQLGLPGPHNDRLPSADLAIQRDLLERLKHAVGKLRDAVDGPVGRDERIDGELAAGGVRSAEIIEEALRPYERNPGAYLEGVVGGVYSILMRPDFSLEDKAQSVTRRLMAAPDHLLAARRQVTAPLQVLVENALGDTEGAAQFFRDELGVFAESISNPDMRTALDAARRAARGALTEFKTFMEKLLPSSTMDFALGREGFDALLRDWHQVPYSAEELYQLGLDVSARLEGDLADSCKRAFGHSRWWEALRPLELKCPAADSLLQEYEAILEQARAFVASTRLVNLSCVGPLAVQPTPPFARANLPFAAYVPAPPFAPGGEGHFWVTPPSPGLSPPDAEKVLKQHHPGRVLVACVHEGYPGHHVQFAHAAHVRRPIRHIFASTVFSEGWGLYCEDLMRREGFRQDGPEGDLINLSLLRDQLWRALRIVVDVGLHCRNMSREDAVRLLVEKHILTEPSAAAEVMYYCSAPTQPMSYMVGKLVIQDVFERCRASKTWAEASAADIRDRILSHGSLPPRLLQRAIGLE